MKLENSFEVPASPEAAWDLLLDVPRVIPCMPGAELLETIDDANWKARMHVKLGPVALAFATDVKREEVDPNERSIKLTARAREERGRGAAQATIESTLVSENGGTRVDIVTDLTLSGAVAQYGRGLVVDVASQLVTRFADCLRDKLAAAPGETTDGVAAAPVKPVGGLSLAFGALVRAIVRLPRRLVRRSRPT